MSSRTKIFAVNTCLTGLHHIFVIISGFIIPKIMLFYYGSDIFGLVTSITQFVSYFMIVEAGLATAGVVALYKPIVNKDYKTISGIVSATRKLYYSTGHIFFLLVTVLAIFYPIFVKLEGMSYYDIALLTLVIGASGTLDFYTMSRFRIVLTAFQKVYIIAIGNIIYVIANIVITYLCAKSGCSIVILKFLVLSSVLARSFFLRLYVHHYYYSIDYKAKPIVNALKNRWDALYLQILGAIHTGTPIILITVFCSLTDVSVYAVFNIAIAGILGLLSLFSTSLFPSFGDIIARKDKSLLQSSFEKFEILYYMLLGIISTCLFLLLQNFVSIYTNGVEGNSEYSFPLLGYMMTANMLLHNIKTPQGMLVLSAGLFKETRIQTSIQGLLAIFCGAIMGYFWGIKGVILGIMISNIYRDIDLMFFIPKRVTGMKWTATFKRIVIMIIAIFVSFFCLKFCIEYTNNWKEWIYSGVISFLVSSSIFIIMFYLAYPKDIKESFIQLKNILK